MRSLNEGFARFPVVKWQSTIRTSSLRKTIGVRGYAEIHAGFVRHAHALDLLDPKLPMLPKNRRKGLVVIADSTTIQAYCSTNGKKQPDGTCLFTNFLFSHI